MLTPAEVERIFRDAGALRDGHFVLSSGKHSPRYLEKFWVLQWPKQTERLCAAIVEHAGPLGPNTIAGPTTGGIILAHEVARQMGKRAVYAERSEDGRRRELRRGFQLAADERVVVVDDILTTGGSVQETIAAVRASGGSVAGAVVIVDRSGGAAAVDAPLRSLWSLDIPVYDANVCPLCARGEPLTRPGTTPARVGSAAT